MNNSKMIQPSNPERGNAAYIYSDTARRQMRSAEDSLSCALSVLDGLRELELEARNVRQALTDVSPRLDECVTRLDGLKEKL